MLGGIGQCILVLSSFPLLYTVRDPSPGNGATHSDGVLHSQLTLSRSFHTGMPRAGLPGDLDFIKPTIEINHQTGQCTRMQTPIPESWLVEIPCPAHQLTHWFPQSLNTAVLPAVAKVATSSCDSDLPIHPDCLAFISERALPILLCKGPALRHTPLSCFIPK